MLAIAQFFAREAREHRQDPDLIRARTTRKHTRNR